MERDPPDLDALWMAFAATDIWVKAECGWVVFRPRQSPGGMQTRWPFEDTAEVPIVTAWNPGSRRRAAAENAAAQRRLAADLEAAGGALLPAAGVAADASWAEPSLAVRQLATAAVRDVARRYAQRAIYVLTREALQIEGCLDDRSLVLGWSLRDEEGPPPLSGAYGAQRRSGRRAARRTT